MENKKINIAELLKDCPKGMELNCLMYENCALVEVTESKLYPIKLTCNGLTIRLSKYGGYSQTEFAKCIIFPKGKTTWEGFVPPCEFKDGDVVAKDTSNGTQLFISKEDIGNGYAYCYMMLDYDGKAYFGVRSFHVGRLATEEEKAKLFQAIKDNGYKWNTEKKCLEKLIKPKFKVGDIIQDKDGYKVKIAEINTEDRLYDYGIGCLSFDVQDNWELVTNKFDISTLKPFNKVLGRSTTDGIWRCDFLFNIKENGIHKYECIAYCYKYCIPYKGNEHLRGTTDDCNEYYKIWED